ncbi:MAG: hypothetical protein ACLSVP_03645 [Fusobacterium sp.]
MTKVRLLMKLRNEEIGFENIFMDSFMKKYTEFENFYEFQEEIQEKCKNEKDLEKFIKINTKFQNVEKLKETAVEYFCRYN